MSKIIRLAVLLVFLLTLFVSPFSVVYATSGITVSNTVVSGDFNVPSQRKSFTTGDFEFVFFQKSGNLVYSSSADFGGNWSTPVVVRAVTSTLSWSVAYDGAHIAYAYAVGESSGNSHLYWRLGTPNEYGNITWLAAEQDITGVTASAGQGCNVGFDSSGYSWIYFGTYNLKPVAIKNANVDGTWSTASGFPLDIASGGHTLGLFSLDGGKMVFYYTATIYTGSTYLKARSWDGAALRVAVSSPSQMTVAEAGYGYVSGFSFGLYVQTVYSASGSIYYTSYSYDSNSFSADELIYTHAGAVGVLSYSMSTNRMYVYWENSPVADSIYYRYQSASGLGSWSDTTLILAESAGLPSASYSLNNNSVCYGLVGLYYIADGSLLKFYPAEANLGAPICQALDATAITSTTATLNGYCVWDGGLPSTATFYYSTSVGEGNKTYEGDIFTADEFSVEVTDLIPDTAPCYWIVIENANGDYWSNLVCFVTESTVEVSVPIVETRAVVFGDVTDTTARLTGLLKYDGGLDCQVGFQYRVDGSGTWLTGWNSTAGGFWHTYDDFEGSLSSLQKNTTYEYRAVAKNAMTAPGNVSAGETMEFTTSYYAPPTPVGGVGFEDLIPDSLSHYFQNWNPMVKMILAIIITIGGMALLAVKTSRAKASGLAVGAYGGLATIGFLIAGWYPQWVLILLGAVVGVLLLLIILGGRK